MANSVTVGKDSSGDPIYEISEEYVVPETYDVVEEYAVEETYDVEEVYTTTVTVPAVAASTAAGTAIATREVSN